MFTCISKAISGCLAIIGSIKKAKTRLYTNLKNKMEKVYFQTSQYGINTIIKSIFKNHGAENLPPRAVVAHAFSPSLKCTIRNPLRCMNQESAEEIHDSRVTDEQSGILMDQTIGDNIDDDDDEKETTEQDGILFDVDLFSSLLEKVSMADAKLYSKFAYLVNLTYRIPQIHPENLLKYYLVRFVTSSVDTKKQLKGQLAEIEKTRITPTTGGQVHEEMISYVDDDDQEEKTDIGKQYLNQVTASAAAFLQSQTKNILPTSDTTNVVAGDDEMDSEKQAIVDELSSLVSSPCEWFICDDDENRTRVFVIQGSESIASWQTNFFFEPTSFEGLDLPVHRGIYEAALGIYEQLLPHVRAYMEAHSDEAAFRFTGHSLGGSLALLISLMLLMRGEVPKSSLLPVIAFGAPYVLCGGDELLKRLGLPKSHYQSIAIHRDIVPRAFSVYLSDNIIDFCNTVNVKFRSHPCLVNQRMLFSPMGELMILQPDENFMPPHHLLPPGIGFYHVTNPTPEDSNVEKLVVAAKKAFLRSPYPTDILSEASAWGPQGTISKNHDMVSYIKAIRSVIQQGLNRARKGKKDESRRTYWPGFTWGKKQL